MAVRRLRQVDVFTEVALRGNPVAVVLDAAGLDDATMQRLAAWTNLSETTFVLPPTAPDAAYRVRIFTPRRELPFAGHPTIGTAHAVLEAGIVAAPDGTFRQECAAGVLPLRTTGAGAARRLFVRVPPPRVARDRGASADDLARVLGAPVLPSPAPTAIDVGPIWLVAQLATVAAVRALAPDMAGVAVLTRTCDVDGVTVFGLAPGTDTPVVVRSFAPAAGVPEDPVCGSGNASVGAFLAVHGFGGVVGAAYEASQGREVGRDGRVVVAVADEGRAIEIGGAAVTVIEGTLRL